jgi:hypothetical protein
MSDSRPEQTRVSRFLSPMLQGEGLTDRAILALSVISIISFLTGGPLLLTATSGLAGFVLYHLSPRGAYEKATKTGIYPEVVEKDGTYCRGCKTRKEPRTGYKVCYVFDYEIARIEQFSHDGICECDEIDEEEQMENKLKAVA